MTAIQTCRKLIDGDRVTAWDGRSFPSVWPGIVRVNTSTAPIATPFNLR